MTKLEGNICPKCGATGTCYCRCNFCHEQFSEGWKNKDGQKVMNQRTGKYIPHDVYGNPHNECMTKGTGGKYYKGGKQVYVNEKWNDLHEFMRNHLKLGDDGWYHLFKDDKYAGRYEYAPKDHISWDPEQ